LCPKSTHAVEYLNPAKLPQVAQRIVLADTAEGHPHRRRPFAESHVHAGDECPHQKLIVAGHGKAGVEAAESTPDRSAVKDALVWQRVHREDLPVADA